MQGERGSLLDLKSYHHQKQFFHPNYAQQQPGSAGSSSSPRSSPSLQHQEDSEVLEEENRSSSSPNEELLGLQEEDNIKALRALQAAKMIPTGSCPISIRRKPGERRHTLANLR